MLARRRTIPSTWALTRPAPPLADSSSTGGPNGTSSPGTGAAPGTGRGRRHGLSRVRGRERRRHDRRTRELHGRLRHRRMAAVAGRRHRRSSAKRARRSVLTTTNTAGCAPSVPRANPPVPASVDGHATGALRSGRRHELPDARASERRLRLEPRALETTRGLLGGGVSGRLTRKDASVRWGIRVGGVLIPHEAVRARRSVGDAPLPAASVSNVPIC